MGYTFWQGSSAISVGNEFETRRVVLMSLLWLGLSENLGSMHVNVSAVLSERSSGYER